MKVKKEYLKLKARRDVNNEEINLDNIKKKVEAYETKYDDFASVSNKLSHEKSQNYQILLPKGIEQKFRRRKERRKEYLKRKYEEIEDAYEKDIARIKLINCWQKNKN